MLVLSPDLHFPFYLKNFPTSSLYTKSVTPPQSSHLDERQPKPWPYLPNPTRILSDPQNAHISLYPISRLHASPEPPRTSTGRCLPSFGRASVSVSLKLETTLFSSFSVMTHLPSAMFLPPLYVLSIG